MSLYNYTLMAVASAGMISAAKQLHDNAVFDARFERNQKRYDDLTEKLLSKKGTSEEKDEIRREMTKTLHYLSLGKGSPSDKEECPFTKKIKKYFGH